MIINVMCPRSMTMEAMQLAMEMADMNYADAFNYARNIGPWEYGATCGDRDHVGDFIGGFITGWACERSDDPNEEQVEFQLKTRKDVTQV